jgi:hypothetical protein
MDAMESTAAAAWFVCRNTLPTTLSLKVFIKDTFLPSLDSPRRSKEKKFFKNFLLSRHLQHAASGPTILDTMPPERTRVEKSRMLWREDYSALQLHHHYTKPPA